MRITKLLFLSLTCLLTLSITSGKNKCKMRIFTSSIHDMVDGKHNYSCKFYNEGQYFWKGTSKNLKKFEENVCNKFDDDGFIRTRCSVELQNFQKVTCVNKPETNNVTITFVNETLEMDCVSQGISNCSWKRNDAFLHIGSRYEHIDATFCSLRINNTRNIDEGFWQCFHKPDDNANDTEIEKFFLNKLFRNGTANPTFIPNNIKITTTIASITGILTTAKKPAGVIIPITLEIRLIIYLAVSSCVNIALIATVIIVCLKNKKLKAKNDFVPENYSTVSNNVYEAVDNYYDSHYLEPISPASITGNRRSGDGRPPLPRPPSLQENRRISLHSSSESVAVNRNLRLQKKPIAPKDTSGPITQITEQQTIVEQNSYSNLPPL